VFTIVFLCLVNICFFSGYPDYQPTTETPWPVGTLGNATENFKEDPPSFIKKNYNGYFGEVAVSGRDINSDTQIMINQEAMIGKNLTNKGIAHYNFQELKGTVRIVFPN